MPSCVDRVIACMNPLCRSKVTVWGNLAGKLPLGVFYNNSPCSKSVVFSLIIKIPSQIFILLVTGKQER